MSKQRGRVTSDLPLEHYVWMKDHPEKTKADHLRDAVAQYIQGYAAPVVSHCWECDDAIEHPQPWTVTPRWYAAHVACADRYDSYADMREAQDAKGARYIAHPHYPPQSHKLCGPIGPNTKITVDGEPLAKMTQAPPTYTFEPDAKPEIDPSTGRPYGE